MCIKKIEENFLQLTDKKNLYKTGGQVSYFLKKKPNDITYLVQVVQKKCNRN